MFVLLEFSFEIVPLQEEIKLSINERKLQNITLTDNILNVNKNKQKISLRRS